MPEPIIVLDLLSVIPPDGMLPKFGLKGSFYEFDIVWDGIDFNSIYLVIYAVGNESIAISLVPNGALTRLSAKDMIFDFLGVISFPLSSPSSFYS